ncbi:MAG: hypothetical protein GXN93_02410 [Candidatus Diapherotrites archaeon]|nr:hypothetical protein [Candidatus Diapherotrites archaeon]
MKKEVSLLAIAVILALGPAFAADANMYIFAVGSNGEGIPATLHIHVVPGHGQIGITIGNSIVGQDTQESVRYAIQAAAKEANVDWRKYDYLVSIDAHAQEIEGPSAGLPMALLFYSVFTNKPLPKYVSGTGEIYPDGTVYPVGGVFEKAQAAHDVGIKVFIIPEKDVNTTAEIPEEIAPGIVQKVVKTVNIVEYAKKHWGMDVVPVTSLSQAIAAAYGERPETNTESTPANTEVLKNFVPPEYNAVRSKEFRAIAEEMIQNALTELKKAHECNTLYIRDQQVAKYLTSGLQTATDQINQAQRLINRGYYYTAANYAFLALINAKMYRIVCEHPSALDPTSLVFQDYFTSVKTKEQHVSELLSDANVNKVNYAWIGGARVRYIRAESAINTIQNGNISPLSALQQLVSADAWLNSAIAMYDVGKNMNGPALANLDQLAKQSVIAVEDLEEMMSTEDPLVTERADWAREAYNKGWYYAAAMEAAAAEGIAIGDLQSKNGDPTKVLTEDMTKPFKPAGLWSDLYYAHAKYYYEAMKAYLQNGQKSKADDMAKTGIQIYEMAKYINNIDSQINAAPTVTVVTKREGFAINMNLGEIGKNKLQILAVLAIIASFLLILLVVVEGKKNAPTKPQTTKGKTGTNSDIIKKEHQYHHKIIQLEAELRRLEKAAKSGDPEAKKRAAVIKRQIGRYKKLIEKMKSESKAGGAPKA